MMLETLRTVADFFADPSYGVNAELDRVPRDAQDAKPEPVAYIGDSTRDNFVARNEDPPKLKALYISDGGPVDADGEVATTYRDADSVVVEIRVLVSSEETAEAKCDVMHTLRAIVRSVKTLMSDAMQDLRERNGVQIISANRIAYGLWGVESVGNAIVAGVVALDLRVRDVLP